MKTAKPAITAALQEAARLAQEASSNTRLLEFIDQVTDVLTVAFKDDKKVLICGNGGSLCDAQHFAEEFTGKYRNERPALPVLSLSDAAHMSCVGNDFGFDAVFKRGVEAFGQAGDVLIVLSTSGNSSNILQALQAASEKRLKTVAFLGKSGGKAKGLATCEYVFLGETSDRIQELHMMVLHIIIEAVERQLYPHLYR